MSAQDEIRALLARRAQALRDRDVDAAATPYTDSVVRFDLAPPLRTTGTDRKRLAEWFATWQGPIGGEARDWQIVAGEDLAFAYGLVRMTGTKTDGTAVDLWFRETLCLERRDGRWLIAHEHGSVPLTMDGSGLAATDLEP